MDLKISGIGFQGKKEILYGLTKTAQKAKDFEYYSQPAIAARLSVSLHDKQAALDASMKAYLDMVLRDEAFIKTIQEIKPSELYVLHELLQPEQTQHSLVRPANKFKPIMNEVLSSVGRMSSSLREAVAKLYKELEI